MKKSARRVVATTGLAIGLTFSAATFAIADSEYIGGGQWTHGISDSGTVYSNYYHGSSCHGSTAVGTYVDRDQDDAGYTSRASAPEAWTNNQAYWRNTC